MKLNINDFGNLILKYQKYKLNNLDDKIILEIFNCETSHKKDVTINIFKYIFDELIKNLINKKIKPKEFLTILNFRLNKIIELKIKDLDTLIRVESNYQEKQELIEIKKEFEIKIKTEIKILNNQLYTLYLDYYKKNISN